jgi:hypothetical protein
MAAPGHPLTLADVRVMPHDGRRFTRERIGAATPVRGTLSVSRRRGPYRSARVPVAALLDDRLDQCRGSVRHNRRVTAHRRRCRVSGAASGMGLRELAVNDTPLKGMHHLPLMPRKP